MLITYKMADCCMRIQKMMLEKLMQFIAIWRTNCTTVETRSRGQCRLIWDQALLTSSDARPQCTLAHNTPWTGSRQQSYSPRSSCTYSKKCTLAVISLQTFIKWFSLSGGVLLDGRTASRLENTPSSDAWLEVTSFKSVLLKRIFLTHNHCTFPHSWSDLEKQCTKTW